jgi:C-terminal processing protease CtpA/Prc
MYDQMLEKHRGNYYAPLEITFVENKAVVTDFLHKELGPKTGLQKGDIIISVNGKSTDNIVKENLPFMPASNYPAQLRNFSSQLLRSGDTVINITYQHANTIHTTSLSCYPNNNLVRKYESQDTCFRYVTPDIAYIYPGIIKRDYLSKVMPDFMKTKGMIIDLRCYPKESIIYDMAKYLLPEPARFVKFAQPDTETPGLFSFSEYPVVGTKNPSYYKGRIVIIVNEKTQSHAEFTAMSLQLAPRATVIGSTTAGADGNVSRIVLPGGIRTMISGIGVYYPNGKETQRVGIMPDLIVKPTIQGIIQNRDELLEKAIEIINEK